MKQVVTSYAKVLLTMENVSEMVEEAQKTFQNCPELVDALSNPTISEKEKFAVIDRLFPKEIRSYLKVVCRNDEMDSIIDIFSEYHTLQRLQKQCVHAVLEYVTPLTETQLSAMKKMICVKTGKPEVELELQENPDLHGGFVLHIGDEVYDRSLRGIIRNMRKSLIRR